jgi:hypothetical protein
MTLRGSEDGRWWWDGNGWVFVAAAPAGQLRRRRGVAAAGSAVRGWVAGSIASFVGWLRRRLPGPSWARWPLPRLPVLVSCRVPTPRRPPR